MKHTSPAHPVRKGALALLVAVIAAVTAFVALPAVSAQAGPPASATATPNPVIIPAGQTTGSYTLGWTLGGMSSADFYVSVDGGAQVGPFNVTGSPGSNPATITVDTTQVWKMYAKGDHTKVLASVTVKARHLDASCQGAAECAKVAVFAHGTFGQFDVITTHVLAHLELEVHRPGHPVISQKSINPSSTHWQPILSGLTPNTTFDWKLTATDEAGHTEVKTGSFTTLHRVVRVTYNQIKVIDDSDDLSAGDLKFWFGFAGQMDTNHFGEVTVDSGDSVFPFHTSELVDAPDTVALRVVGQDNDCWGIIVYNCFLKFETPTTGPVGHGSTDDEDWATASTDVDVAHDGLAESFSGSTTLSTTQFALQFKVLATFSVSYQ